MDKFGFGEFGNVLLSQDELTKLYKKFGMEKTESYIEKLDGYIESVGKKYKSCYATILNWIRRDSEKSVKKSAFNNFEQKPQDYSVLENRAMEKLFSKHQRRETT